MTKPKKRSLDRRGFLNGAAAGATALVAKPEIAKAQQSDLRRGSAPAFRTANLATSDDEPITQDDADAIARARKDIELGRVVPHDEILCEFDG